MGYSEKLAQQALRFSYGIFTKKEEVELFIHKFREFYKNIITSKIG
jgi:cysteine sulfinate desulfinase/cysteine desulfurase-like protein